MLLYSYHVNAKYKFSSVLHWTCLKLQLMTEQFILFIHSKFEANPYNSFYVMAIYVFYYMVVVCSCPHESFWPFPPVWRIISSIRMQWSLLKKLQVLSMWSTFRLLNPRQHCSSEMEWHTVKYGVLCKFVKVRICFSQFSWVDIFLIMHTSALKICELLCVVVVNQI